ncbi:MAG: DUF1549 domain-containing protein, partial [Planctomycetales bacterium]|nr:DUF1549 domain-containing protein [Planctomycetales bacterium]
MSHNRVSLGLFVLLAALLPSACSAVARADDAADEPAQQEFFQKEVLPILSAKCFRCHGGEEKLKGALRLTTRQGVLEGGDSGAAVDLDDPAGSLLLSAVNYVDFEMPPTGKLPPAQIEVLTRWVKMGLPYPDGLVKIEPHKAKPNADIDPKEFWSFQPVARREPPTVKQADWVKTPVDAFVLSKLEAAGLRPNPPASPEAMVRRVFYDLIGLPPTPREASYWAERLADPQHPEVGVTDAGLESLVDHLLARPQYGEKWGRHWLDLVRYAETNSYERDDAKPEVWRYRDYVVKSFNEDKPYDQFVREQIAGDELASPTPDSVVATGIFRLGRWDDEPVDAEQAWYDDMDDVLLTTSQVFFGLTMNCGRCHDHKIDPITQEDYYRFLAFFSNVERYGGPNRGRDVNRWSLMDLGAGKWRSEHEEAHAARRKELEEVEREIAKWEESVRSVLSPVEKEDFQYDSNRLPVLQSHVPRDFTQQQLDDYAALRRRRDALAANTSEALGRALCVKEAGRNPRAMHVLARGNPSAPGKEVQPGFPRVLGFDDPQIAPAADGAESTGRRLALADWLVDP